jgi:hypothetical protein
MEMQIAYPSQIVLSALGGRTQSLVVLLFVMVRGDLLVRVVLTALRGMLSSLVMVSLILLVVVLVTLVTDVQTLPKVFMGLYSVVNVMLSRRYILAL